MKTDFFTKCLPDQLQKFNDRQRQYNWVNDPRAAINRAYVWYDHLPLPEEAFHRDGLKEILQIPQAKFIVAERVNRIPDSDRGPRDQPCRTAMCCACNLAQRLRVDFFCYMENGHVLRMHPGASTSQDAIDQDMPFDAGLFDCSFATLHGAGMAMHRCPPAHALARGAPLPIDTALITEPQLRAYSKFDTDHWPWKQFVHRLRPSLHEQRETDITDGKAIPWWLHFAHEHKRLQGIINEGILGVTAKLEKQGVVLAVRTSSTAVITLRGGKVIEYPAQLPGVPYPLRPRVVD